MSDPYNNNPFANDTGEINNERDANRALANTVKCRECGDKGYLTMPSDSTYPGFMYACPNC